MTLAGAITTCLRKYVVFSGRATRAEFWWWVLAVVIASIAASIADSVINGLTRGNIDGVLSGIFALAVLLPNLAVTVRRLHDIGKSGWWLLAWIVLVVGPWVILGGLIIGATFGALFSAGSAPNLIEFFAELLIGFALIWVLVILGFIFALLVSVAVIIWQIIWLARQGETGANRYGPDPRAG